GQAEFEAGDAGVGVAGGRAENEGAFTGLGEAARRREDRAAERHVDFQRGRAGGVDDEFVRVADGVAGADAAAAGDGGRGGGVVDQDAAAVDHDVAQGV